MGKNMVVLWVISVCVLLDRDSPRWVRLAAAGLAAIAAFMAVMSESATAVLLVLATGAVVLAGAVFLLGGVMRLSRIAGLCFSLSALFILGAVLFSSLQSNPIDTVLGHFGKDSSLTGRTVLWDYAEDQIAEHPLVGVGADGFWRYLKSPLVQKIYLEFHKGPGDKFNFHNSYYEIAVHQGLIGLVFAVAALLWALSKIIRGALQLGTLPQIYFFAHALAVLSRTVTEADFLKPFTLFHMVLWIGALSALRVIRHRAEVDAIRKSRF
jgi:exopolysaccharide production protein ExoQ